MKRPLLAVLSLLLVACSTEEPVSPLTLNTEGNHYHNAFFGLSVDKPEGWYAQSLEETLAISREGSELLAGDKEEMRAMIDASLEASFPIFGFFAHPPGTPDKLNPNVLSVAENISDSPEIRSACDYLENVQALLLQSSMDYRFDGGCETRQLAGKALNVIEGQVQAGPLTITQRYYVTLKDKYALSFIQTYFSAEGEQLTSAVLESLVIE